MKCPYCAEEIKDEAKKCRFCGEILTKADKMGYPRFYKNVVDWGGLTYEALLMDYMEHLNLDWEDSCLIVKDPIGCIFNLAQSEYAEEWHRGETLLEAITERYSTIDPNSQELIVLKVIHRYLRLVMDFVNNNRNIAERMANDPKELRFCIQQFRELQGKLDSLNSESREDLHERLQRAAETCEKRLNSLSNAQSQASAAHSSDSSPQSSQTSFPTVFFVVVMCGILAFVLYFLF